MPTQHKLIDCILDRVWPFSRLRDYERKLAEMRDAQAAAKNARDTELEYLRSRDRLCSGLANDVNRLMFQVATLRGDYDHLPRTKFNDKARL